MRSLFLKLLYHIVSIPNYTNKDTLIAVYKYAFLDLIELIQFVLKSETFSVDEWQYIDFICTITYKLQLNMKGQYVKDIDCFLPFFNLFENLAITVIFSYQNEPVFTDSISNFHSNPQLFTHYLSSWYPFFQFFLNLNKDIQLKIFQATKVCPLLGKLKL